MVARKSVESAENDRNGVFHGVLCSFGSANLALAARGAAPRPRPVSREGPAGSLSAREKRPRGQSVRGWKNGPAGSLSAGFKFLCPRDYLERGACFFPWDYLERGVYFFPRDHLYTESVFLPRGNRDIKQSSCSARRRRISVCRGICGGL